jgi:multimeric flavodoxin WrbA
MVEKILPAIEKADAVIWLCPNYNDAISANLAAVINRMTALYRKTPFYKKTLFSIVVSGNSGSDSVAKQLIGALCINKGFNLPPYFSLMSTANNPGAISQIPNIETAAKDFAENMLREIKKP